MLKVRFLAEDFYKDAIIIKKDWTSLQQGEIGVGILLKKELWKRMLKFKDT